MVTVLKEQKQDAAARAALAAKRDGRDPMKLRGVERELYELLTARELRKLIDYYNNKY